MPVSAVIAAVIARWATSSSSEQANSTLFLAERCDVLELKCPDPATSANESNAYICQRKVFMPIGGAASPK